MLEIRNTELESLPFKIICRGQLMKRYLSEGGTVGRGAVGYWRYSERSGAPLLGRGGLRPAALAAQRPAADPSAADIPAAATKFRGKLTFLKLKNTGACYKFCNTVHRYRTIRI